MAKPLSDKQQEQIKSLFIAFGSIRDVSKKLNLSRNTVRKVVRQLNVSENNSPPPKVAPVPCEPNLCHIDFVMLEKLFELGRSNAENMSFENDLKKITNAIAKELGVNSTTDQLKLEGAMFSLIVYRRFYFNSLSASDKRYNGPLSKAHDKQVRAVRDWVELSQRALDQWLRLIKELEIKYGKRPSYYGRGNVFVQANIQNNSVA
jgi:hypothetical protein